MAPELDFDEGSQNVRLPSGADIVSLHAQVRFVPKHKVAALQPAAREKEPRGR